MDIWLTAIISGLVSGAVGGALGATITLKWTGISQSSKGKESPNIVSGGKTDYKRR